jgi:acetamidase/formamidase
VAGQYEGQAISDCHSDNAAGLVCLSAAEVAFEIEVVFDVGMDLGELLQTLHGPEQQHRLCRGQNGR